jgi:hypothetical protein
MLNDEKGTWLRAVSRLIDWGSECVEQPRPEALRPRPAPAVVASCGTTQDGPALSDMLRRVDDPHPARQPSFRAPKSLPANRTEPNRLVHRSMPWLLAA